MSEAQTAPAKPKKKLSLALARQRAAAEKEGAWFDYEHGGRFFVHYYRHTDYLAKRELEREAERAALGLKPEEDLPRDASNRAAARAMFGTMVSKWEDVEDEFTLENFVELMLSDVQLAISIDHFATAREKFWGAALSGLVRD